jgi:hypothetical protein
MFTGESSRLKLVTRHWRFQAPSPTTPRFALPLLRQEGSNHPSLRSSPGHDSLHRVACATARSMLSSPTTPRFALPLLGQEGKTRRTLRQEGSFEA